jgi:hypothetical protein
MVDLSYIHVGSNGGSETTKIYLFKSEAGLHFIGNVKAVIIAATNPTQCLPLRIQLHPNVHGRRAHDAPLVIRNGA